jgi:cephalosporin hydroxylase
VQFNYDMAGIFNGASALYYTDKGMKEGNVKVTDDNKVLITSPDIREDDPDCPKIKKIEIYNAGGDLIMWSNIGPGEQFAEYVLWDRVE